MISLNEILLITPELFIVGFSLIILLSDLIFGSKFRSSDIASLGILASLIITILLFSGVIKINDISKEINNEGELINFLVKDFKEDHKDINKYSSLIDKLSQKSRIEITRLYKNVKIKHD